MAPVGHGAGGSWRRWVMAPVGHGAALCVVVVRTFLTLLRRALTRCGERRREVQSAEYAEWCTERDI
eukprot:gene17890-26909_t